MRSKSLLEHVLTGLVIGNGCWEWKGRKDSNGYGRMQMRVGGRRVYPLAHRVVYEMVVGEIPGYLEIDHLCRNTSCVRPDHLEPVSHAENMRRTRLKACTKGHALVEGNITPASKGNIRCLTCTREHVRKRESRMKAVGRCPCGRVPDPGYKCCRTCIEKTRKVKCHVM